ncbi:NADH:ubiquinone oxidoreductase, NDUFA8/PGIV/19 kDa subunit [Phaffia rhodozyma]|uniref:NADH-ubiquinone oxidoreductase n=1 Tax=Phaffia rhodozyma TaxID=264483 RepID=A0A0F7SS84_PHARH|nr:NADH:ubiquinone oxidoreductase, NDUFA8/PGIV/19 kDa subunit [Phaffia rhodozyma]
MGQDHKFRGNQYNSLYSDVVEPNPLPSNILKVTELGVTSAPLKSASFFLAPYCKDYTEDFMLCKAENQDPAYCLAEGRRVTRCATDFINKMRENCAQLYEAHWQCLERNNQDFYACRNRERPLNACVFEKIDGLKKELPGATLPPVHERTNVYFKPSEG